MLSACNPDIELIIEAARSVLEFRSFEDASRRIFDLCKRKLGAKSGYVALLSADGAENEVLFLDAGGLPCTVDENLPMPIRGLRGEAYRTGKPAYENDFTKSEWVKFMPPGHVALRNVLFAPLILDGKAIGLIGLANKPGDFTPDDAEWASIFAEIAAIALHNNYLIESLHKSERKYHAAFEKAKLLQSLLAHDMNNILQAIISSVEVSRKLLEMDDKHKLNEMLSLIERQFDRGRELITKVRKLTELEDQPMPLKKVEICAVLEEAIANIQGSFESKEIKIQHNLTNVCYTLANPIILDVFENILHNAVKHNRNDIIEISVNVTHAREDGMVQFEFIDNGVGVSDDLKNSIFQSHHQIGGEFRGLGVGLSLVKKAVELFNGRISVEDRVQGDYTKGSKFIILLPEA
jgi:signal transduction histidine kinase